MMFRFPLQPGLDVAAARERAAGAASCGARAILEEARRARCVVAERDLETRSLRTALGGSPAAAASWIAIEEYGERLGRLRVVHERAVAVADASARAAPARHADERLRERRLAEHRARAALREAADFDESNAARFVPGTRLR